MSNLFEPLDPNNEILNGTPWYFNKQNNTGDKDGLGIAPFEDIRSFVQLYMRPRNPNFIQLGDYDDERASFSIPQDNSIVVIGGYLEKDKDKYYSTNYTDELMGNSSTDNEKNYEGFGIKSVDITFDANKIPQITVVFYDLRGNVLNNFNSKYAKMFQLPYPKFVLDIKGGFGPLISYKIVKVRDDISIDEMGNYIITSKFIGDRFSPFSDLPLLYLITVPYLKGLDVKSDFINDNKITSFHELVINSKKLYEKLAQIKESDTEKKNQADFAQSVDDLTNYNDTLKIFQTPDEFYKWFVDIEENKDIVLKYIKQSEFDTNNSKIKFIYPIEGLTDNDKTNILTTIEGRLKPINDEKQLVTYAQGITASNNYVREIDYSLLITEVKSINDKVRSKGLDYSQAILINISQLPSQVLGETRLTIGNIFKIIIEDYNYLMNRIFEEGNKGYQEIITNNTNRTQQKFDKMGFPTVIQGNQIIYPGVIPEFQKWPEIVFIEQFIDAYYRAIKDTVISDILLNKEEDGRQKYIPINPREYYKNNNIKEPVVNNAYYGIQLVDLYKLIYQRFLCFANININLNVDSKVYSTWTGSEDEEKDWIDWTKDFLGLFDFSDKDIQKGLFYSIINMEARNIAYAISLNNDYKKAIKDLSTAFNNSSNDWIKNNPGSELSRSIENITNNTISIQNIVTNTTPLVIAPTNTTQTANLGLQLATPTTPQVTNSNFIQPLDDNYVTVSNIGPTPIDVNNTTSGDYITEYMLKVNKAANSGYKITRDNILYIPDKKLEGGNNQSDYYFESNNADDEFIILTNLLVDNFSQAFNFKKFANNCAYTGLLQIPKGMLIVLANLLREKETNNGNFNKYNDGEILGITVYGGIQSSFFVIRKNSSFYNYLENLYTEAYLPDKGFSINFINDNSKISVVVRKDLASTEISEIERDLIEKIKKYLYEPVYISINDTRFINGGIPSKQIINGITNTTDSTPTLYKQYLKLLLKKITEFVKIDDDNLDKKLKSFTSYIKDPQVKLSIYKSFQVIYENYLHGVQKKDFEQVVSRDINLTTFRFVDRGYNDISDLCILDIKTLLNDANDYEVSLFSSMARLLADNNFWFYPFQNFLTTENDYKDLFKINFDKKGKTKPKFVAMYVGGLSSNPNSPVTSPIQDDGIKKDKIPDDLTNNGTGLNAFLVKYTGIQNQSVFSNLQVSTESLKNTDEGLRIQSEIITNASNSFSIPKGQSLLNVYQKQSYTSTIKIPFGNAAIQPTQYYYQEYIPLFDGLYIIYNVTHNMDAETQRLETTFKGYRLKKDVNPIVTQEFVDFLNNDIYTEILGDLTTPIITTGTKLAPIRNLIGQFESNGDYEIYNIGLDGRKGATSFTKKPDTATKLTDKTISQIITYQTDANFDFFAVGKYQIIPDTLKNLTNGLNRDTTKFDANTQDSLCDSLLLSDNKIDRYLNNKNKGSIGDLEDAVQAIAKIWAAMPVINAISGGNKKTPPIKGKFGDVETGIGSTGYYGGIGINKSNTQVGVNSVVQALITSRIQQCGVKPTFIPTYYTDTTNSGTLPNNDAKFVTIGDSLSVGLTLYTKKIVDIKTPVPLSIAGKRVEWLLNMCNGIQPKPNIPNLIVSIGANDGYGLANVDKLITAINTTFPDSKKFIINGSYGWDMLKLTKDKDDAYWKNQINTFMDKFTAKNYVVLGEIVKRTGHPQGKKGDTFFDPIVDDLKIYGLQ